MLLAPSVADADPALVASVRARLQRSAARLQQIADSKHAAAARRCAECAADVRTSARRLFEQSPEWRAMSADVRAEQPWCSECGSTEHLQADHVLPKSKFPELALVRSNLRTLCWPCNRRKAARVLPPGPSSV